MYFVGEIVVWYFLMYDVGVGCYLLNVVGVQCVMIVEVVVMFDGIGQYVGNGFDVVMWMLGEIFEIFCWVVIVEIIYYQEWIGQ